MGYPIEENNWVLLQAEDADGPLVVRLNRGIDAIRGHPDFAHQVGIAVPIRKPNHVGFPEKDELEQRNALQEAIIPALEKDQDSVLVLVLTGAGVREFVLYTRSPGTVRQRVQELAKSIRTHEVQSIVQEDPEWNVYDAYSVPQDAIDREAGKNARAADSSEKFPHMVIARFYENAEPLDRGERFEDPLQAALDATNAGAVTGGGSQLGPKGLLEFADVEILLADLNGAVDVAVKALEDAGALRGSELRQGDKVIREFGKLECVAVFLDGVNLPQEVYDNLDFDDLLARLEAAGGQKLRSTWAGNEETGLFYASANAEELGGRLEAALRGMPIGENARIVVRFGKESLGPRTVKLTR